MSSDFPVRRRELLVSGSIAAAVLTAGCGSGGGETDGEGGTNTTGGDDSDDDTEEQEQPTNSEEGDTSEETDSDGPLTAEWATPYPDDIGTDRLKRLGDLALGEQRAFVTAGDGASVLAYDIADGELLWRWEEYVDQPAPAVTYHDAVGPIAILRSQGNNGDVYALDPASGTVQWEYQDESVGSLVSAATDEYVVTGGGTGVAVLDPADGRVVTKFGGVDGVDFFHTDVDVGSSQLFGIDQPGNAITGYDLETGGQRWQISDFEMDRIGDVLLTVVDGLVVGTDSKSVFGIDPETEAVTFRFEANAFDRTFTGGNSQVYYINETNPNETVRAVDVTEGAIDWEQTDVMATAPRPALTDDRLLVVTRSGLSLLDAGTGDIIQQEFDPNNVLETESEYIRVMYIGARSDTAVVAGRAAIYGLSIQN